MSPRSRGSDTHAGAHPGGRPTRAQAAALDNRIREAALELFLRDGYEDTSMNAIAAAAHTTKPTLYARYPTKDEIFRTVIGWAVSRKDWPIPEPPTPDLDDLEQALRTIAQTLLNRALDPSMVRLEQIAIAHASRYPDIARRTYGSGTWPRHPIVVELLRRHAAEGTIEVDDPDRTAMDFLGLASGTPARLASFGIPLDEQGRQAHIESVVTLFLRALRPS
ncbi:TetR/AcrR family transcriptional regulator [Gordonia sp. CPCC 206044]|uniref:TetR/AcrR family transcriptional regulator n=1 Tax=Gordonia sp. CPCC 206044 TaxID=3140793 RepID=UPI003AF3559F